ncbi:hypothetical protein COLO4_20335 [Corchorus olitorius]|uniref:Uncharacterized protein n=1 Tax=Corchorus olitorius TaxID=93759 RepID=A0A1R3J0B3_9ROSI|nr:hypothetical protein COLO4_20335 [Corchorus olitorius]
MCGKVLESGEMRGSEDVGDECIGAKFSISNFGCESDFFCFSWEVKFVHEPVDRIREGC